MTLINRRKKKRTWEKEGFKGFDTRVLYN